MRKHGSMKMYKTTPARLKKLEDESRMEVFECLLIATRANLQFKNPEIDRLIKEIYAKFKRN